MLWRLADFFSRPAPDPAQLSWLGSVAYAHRGLHGPDIAENSPSAFAAAIAAGLGIECDIRLSGDGRAMVFHDADLQRLTRQEGQLDRLSVGALTQIPLAVGGEKIPTLRDVLQQVSGQKPLLLELKSDPGQSAGQLCLAVRRDLEGYQGPVAVMSFDPRIGQWFADKAPNILRGLVVSEQGSRGLLGNVRRVFSLLKSGAQFLAYDIRDLPSPFAARQAARGLPLLSWTVSTVELRDRARKYVDAPIAEGAGLTSDEQPR